MTVRPGGATNTPGGVWAAYQWAQQLYEIGCFQRGLARHDDLSRLPFLAGADGHYGYGEFGFDFGSPIPVFELLFGRFDALFLGSLRGIRARRAET